MRNIRLALLSALFVATGFASACSSYGPRDTGSPQMGVSATDLHTDSTQALNALYRSNPAARELDTSKNRICSRGSGVVDRMTAVSGGRCVVFRSPCSRPVTPPSLFVRA